MNPSPSMLIAFGVVTALELILSVAWLPWYVRSGIPVWWRRYRLDPSRELLPSSTALTARFGSRRTTGLAFERVSRQQVAFRERWFDPSNLSLTYPPVMRALMSLDPERREIRAVGFLNWYPLAGALLALDAALGSREPNALLLPGLVVVPALLIYWIQVQRFETVVDFVARGRRP